MTVRISHPTHPDPLVIGQADVRWVKGFEFGVALLGPLEKGTADRLHCLLDDVLDSGIYSEGLFSLQNGEAYVQ